MLNQEFVEKGFSFIGGNDYIDNQNHASLHDLKKSFDLDLDEDKNCPFRRRAYLKVEWRRETNELRISENQAYFQTAASNVVDGGAVRQFKMLDKKIMDLPIVDSILRKNINMIKNYQPLMGHENLTIGIHFIRYVVNEWSASYSSPDWLHKDDEPLVFIHLVGLSRFALGGDNLIASDDGKITNVIRLESEMETLVLNQSVYHAVTPLGSRQGIATRDVILFTVEPGSTQVST